MHRRGLRPKKKVLSFLPINQAKSNLTAKIFTFKTKILPVSARVCEALGVIFGVVPLFKELPDEVSVVSAIRVYKGRVGNVALPGRLLRFGFFAAAAGRFTAPF